MLKFALLNGQNLSLKSTISNGLTKRIKLQIIFFGFMTIFEINLIIEAYTVTIYAKNSF